MEKIISASLILLALLGFIINLEKIFLVNVSVSLKNLKSHQEKIKALEQKNQKTIKAPEPISSQ